MMGRRRTALLGSMLLLAGALAGCAADPADSDDDSDDVVTVQDPLGAAPPATPPNGSGNAAAANAVATRNSAPDVNGNKQQDPEPSPWIPGQSGNGMVDSDNGDQPDGNEPEPSPWKDPHGDAIRMH